MGEHIDEAKGRAKQAAGDLTDDEKLRREGKVDRTSSSVKDKIDDASDKVSETIDDAADKVKEKIGRRPDRD
ncbi:MAG: CsbD family protein [Solirubrobacterales bacterium]